MLPDHLTVPAVPIADVVTGIVGACVDTVEPEPGSGCIASPHPESGLSNSHAGSRFPKRAADATGAGDMWTGGKSTAPPVRVAVI